MTKCLGNVLGAFSDGAILFPLLAILCLENGFSSGMLLLTAGLAYVISGWVFRIPMPVQPLKAVVAGAIAVGASAAEIRLSGALVGLFCLLITFTDFNSISKRIPRPIIHGIQLGLGIVLMLKGLQIFMALFGSTRELVFPMALFLLVVTLLVVCSERLRFPFLGLVATTGLVLAFFFPGKIILSDVTSLSDRSLLGGVSVSIIVTLVVSQLVLTLANSVVATDDVAHRYFPKDASRVTPKGLLYSIGLGNLFSAVVGGLPFCHGSGGLTAHVRGGSTHWSSNLIIGFPLLGLAAVNFFGNPTLLRYPPLLAAILLVSVGFFHLKLAKPSWELKRERSKLILMGVVALFTHHMLLVLCAGLGAELVQRFFEKRLVKRRAM